MSNDIRGNSPQTPESESPNAEGLHPLTVRDILNHIHTAAQQSRRAGTASEDTLLYIKEKEKLAISASKLQSDKSFDRVLWHIRATRESTKTVSSRVSEIERITARALNLPFQVVQS